MSQVHASRVTPEVVLAAHARGFVRLQTAPIARAAGVSESSVRSWAQGEGVSPATDTAIRNAIGALASIEATVA